MGLRRHGSAAAGEQATGTECEQTEAGGLGDRSEFREIGVDELQTRFPSRTDPDPADATIFSLNFPLNVV